MDAGDEPLPERQRLGVGVVDAEHTHAVRDPEEHDVAQRLPQRLAVVGVEVDREDVLVALGRVLGVADRAVGAVPEPLRVLGHPGVVGAALQRVVESHLEARLARGGDEGVEVLHGPELGVDGRVAAVGRADRPRAAGVLGAGVEAVVRPLAMGEADRVDRREVDDVEAHLGERRQPGRGGAQRAGVVRRSTLGAREELVPRRERAELAVDPQRERTGERRRAAVDGAAHQRHGGGAFGRGDPRARARSLAQCLGERHQRAAVADGDAAKLGATLGHERALLELEGHVLAVVEAQAQVAQPRAVVVGHADHLEAPVPHLLGDEAGAVHVVGGAVERELPPARRHPRRRRAGRAPRRSVAGPRQQEVVPVGDGDGAHLQGDTDGALGRVRAAVDGRAHALDDHPSHGCGHTDPPVQAGGCQPNGPVRVGGDQALRCQWIPDDRPVRQRSPCDHRRRCEPSPTPHRRGSRGARGMWRKRGAYSFLAPTALPAARATPSPTASHATAGDPRAGPPRLRLRRRRAGRVQWTLASPALDRLLSGTATDGVSAQAAGPNVVLTRTIGPYGHKVGHLAVIARRRPGREWNVHAEWAGVRGGHRPCRQPDRDRVGVARPGRQHPERPRSRLVAGVGEAPHSILSWVAPAGSFDEIASQPGPTWASSLSASRTPGAGPGSRLDSASFLVDPVALGSLTQLFTGESPRRLCRRGVRVAAGRLVRLAALSVIGVDRHPTRRAPCSSARAAGARPRR